MLINIFQDEFKKILSQQSTNVRFYYYITESSELNLKKKVRKHAHLAIFLRRNT